MRRGFTLIEILIVISIIGILSTIGLITYSGTQAKTRDSVRKADLGKLALALEAYFQKNGTYIPPADTGVESCQKDTDKFYQDITPFIQGGVPKDPKDGENYCYIAVNEGVGYRLFSKLENCQDRDIIPSIDCSTADYNYSIVSDDLAVAFAPGDFLPADPTAYRRVFTTSTRYPGNMEGLAGADAKCQQQADVGSLGGTWKAWLSSTSISAASRLNHFNGPYRRIDGTTIANDWNDLTDGNLAVSISITEYGLGISTSDVWTNTTTAGGISGTSPINTCSSWTNTSTSRTAFFGFTNRTDFGWTYSGGENCANQNRLYCFEQ